MSRAMSSSGWPPGATRAFSSPRSKPVVYTPRRNALTYHVEGFCVELPDGVSRHGHLLLFGGVAARLVWLHVLERDELLKYLDQARRSFVVENARRGNIRAARGELLATSRTLLDIGLDPHMLRPEDEARWPDLARLLGIKVERHPGRRRPPSPRKRPRMTAARPNPCNG